MACRNTAVVAVVCAGLWAATAAAESQATDWPSGEDIAQRANARDDGKRVARTFVMELRSARGKVRRRETRSFRGDFQDSRRSVLFFEEPANLEGTALLTYDYPEVARDDDQWIYLPAVRKSRRVATKDRGQSVLGTDLSFEDLKKETKLSVPEYQWKTLGQEQVDGHRCWLLEAVPIDDETARELGYGRVLFRIDAEIWMPRMVEYWTPNLQPLKVIELLEIREVQGIWTAHEVMARNLRTGHQTRFLFQDVQYGAAFPDDLFTERALRRGPQAYR